MNSSSNSSLSSIGKIKVNFKRYGPIGMVKWLYHQFEWRWFTRVKKVRFVERNIQQFKLIIDLRDVGLSKELFLSDIREEEHIYMLERYLKPGMAVLDCGANIGYYTVMMGRMVGESGKIYSVEPSKDNYEMLSLNVRLNQVEDRAVLFNMGMAEYDGVGEMHVSEMSNRHTFHPFEYYGPSEQTLRGIEPLEVPVSTVSTFTKDRPVDLIRMDVEGYEVEIMTGMKDALESGDFRASILFEVHRPRYDFDKHDIRGPLQSLFDHGYIVKWLAIDGYKERNTREQVAQMGYSDSNLVAKFASSDRAVYSGFSNEHALELISTSESVRAAFLERVTE